MIDQEYYGDARNRVRTMYGGKRLHFNLREPSITTESRVRTLEYGENFLNIAEPIFGKGKQHLWPYLCDCNITRHPDDWQLEDEVNIPKTIVVPKTNNERNF
jgi:hypothetical protein